MNRVESGLIAALCVALALIFLYLTGYALFFTSVIADQGYISEPIEEKQDAFWPGLLTLACGLALLWLFGFVEKYLPLRLAVALALGWALAAGVYWVCAAQTLPRADAGYIATAAQRAINGNFSELRSPSGYLNQHPYQVGFMMVSQILQFLFGMGNYTAMQVFNAVVLTAAYGAVLSLAWNATGSPRVVRYAALLLALCIQPILYCTFLYGNLLSVCCALWAGNLLLGAVRSQSAWRFAPASLLCGLSVLFKPNGWLPVLAMMILAALWMLTRRKWRALPLLASLIAVPLLVTGGVKAAYSARANADLSKGVPMTAYLAMGLQESSRASGWYNEYVDRVYKSNGYDPQKTSESAVRNIFSRLEDFGNDPAYAVAFFHEKMVSQWNETTFEAVWVNKVCPYQVRLRLPLAKEVLNGSLRAPLEAYMERYAILLYASFTAGLSLLAWELLRRGCGPERPAAYGMGFAAATVCGAFLYHMLFEAKSQYLFVYLLLMIPVAAYALARFGARRRVNGGQDLPAAHAGQGATDAPPS